MSRTLLCLLSLILTLAAARIPDAYNGNTLYATPSATAIFPSYSRYIYNASSPQYINFTVYNNFDSDNMHMWVTGIDLVSGNVVMLLPNSTFYFPKVTAGSTGYAIGDFVAIPLPTMGNTINVPLPGYIGSARVFFADGKGLTFGAVPDGNGNPAIQQPTAGIHPTDNTYNINWGYMELSYGPTMTGNTTTGTIAYVDISEVDFAGLPVGFSLYGCEYGVLQVPGLQPDAVSGICSSVYALPPSNNSIPAAPWNSTCIIDSTGDPIRAVSPGDVGSSNFDAFWSKYVDEVYDYYTNNVLELLDAYSVFLGNCTVIQDNLNCTGPTGFNRTFSKPSASDIYSCSTGPFQAQQYDSYAVGISVPILCAAFNRGTFLLPGGNVQPQQSPSIYYTNDINNYYSKFVHQYAYGGIGYAFPYDDVTPADETNESGTLVDTAPLMIAMTVGGPVSSLIPATPLSGVSCPTYPAAPAGAGGGGGGGSGGSSGPKTFPYNPVVAGPTCTVNSSAANTYSTATPSKVAAYTYLGCWTDDNSNRTLQHQIASDDMTLEYCAGNATYEGYAIFGVEYMYQCFADQAVWSGACPALSADCSMACTGNSNQMCGGPNRINLYQIIPVMTSSTSSSAATSTSSSSSSGWQNSTSSLMSTSASMSPNTLASLSSNTSTSLTTITATSNGGSPSSNNTSFSTTMTTSMSTSTSTTTSTTSTSSTTPLATSTGVAECHTIFLTGDSTGSTTYRIYCDASISGTDLITNSPFAGTFTDCIALCASYIPSYNTSACIGSVFTNGTSMDSCVLKANSTSAAAGTTGTPARRKVKRDGTQVFYAQQVFAALRLLDPAVDQGPADPPSPYTSSVSLPTSSNSNPSPSPSPSSSTTTSPLLTAQSPSQSLSAPIPPLNNTLTTPPFSNSTSSMSISESQLGHLFTPPGNPGVTLTAQAPGMAPSPPIPYLPGQPQRQGQAVCEGGPRRSVTVLELVTVSVATCPATVRCEASATVGMGMGRMGMRR